MRCMFVVIYFLFVIAVSVFSVLVTIVILHMYLRAENKPVAAMPAWVSIDSLDHLSGRHYVLVVLI